jgi:hypothetical protein
MCTRFSSPHVLEGSNGCTSQIVPKCLIVFRRWRRRLDDPKALNSRPNIHARARTLCRRQYEGDASLVPPIVVHGLEVKTVSSQWAVPPLRQARGPPRQYAYRHLDGPDDGSEDKAGTDRGMSVAWSPAVQRPLDQGVERLTCSPTPEPTSAEVPFTGTPLPSLI